MKIGIDQEIQGTSVPVRWCLSREELNMLAKTGEKAYMLIMVIFNPEPDSFKKPFETRHLVPVEQALEYIDFNTPEKHKIFSTVVWKKCEEDNLKKIFLGKDRGYWEKTLYNFYDDELTDFDYCGFGVHKFEVVVPREVFAKEPPIWEKKWVNWFFEDKPRDQCCYRRRRLFAYTIQPPVILISFLALEIATSVIISVLLLFGSRGIGFRKIFHPFMEPFCSIWDETRGSIFGTSLIYRLLPSIFLGGSIVSWVVCKNFEFQFFFAHQYLFVKAIITGGVLVGMATGTFVIARSCCWAGARLMNKLINFNSKNKEQKKKQKRLLAEAVKEERERKIREKLEVKYQLLVCDGSLSAKVSSLPQEKRTINLRYKDLKSRICKSFAR